MKICLLIISTVFATLICTASSELHVMSFNIRCGNARDGENQWSNRRELLFNLLREHDPDVIGLQEALRFQIDEIRAALPCYAELGVAREGGDKGEYSAILYRKSRLDVAKFDTFWLSDTPEKPSSTWGNTCIRICTWARFIDKQSGNNFYVYNTHLDHRSQPSREKSVRLIAQRVSAANIEKLPVVLTGDFNVGEDNPVVQYLTGGCEIDEKAPLKLQDSFRMLYPDEKTVGTFNGFKGLVDGAKIDYIFVNESVEVLSAAIIRPSTGERCPSDHFPLTARLRF